VLAVTLVFGQTLLHGFVDYDDSSYVYENPQVARGLTVEGVALAFSQSHAFNWHPLTWLSHMLDCQLYGLQHPGGHHLTNVLLHAATAVLLFLVLRQMSGDLWPSAFVAALFAVHPLHVESVAWVAERKDVLSGLFFVLTLIAYVAYARREFSLFRYLLVTALFACGLMAKPMLVTLPFVLLLLDYWPLGRVGGGRWAVGGECEEAGGAQCEVRRPRLTAPRSLRPVHTSPPTAHRPPPTSSTSRVLLEKLPWIGMTIASCVVTQLAQQEAVKSLERYPLPWRVGNALFSFVAYLGQLVYPAGLAVFYPHPGDSLPYWQIAGASLVLVGITLAVVALRKKHPYLLVGWLWYLGMLVPVIGLVQVGSQGMADRYTYLTQIGLYLAVAWGATHLLRTVPYLRSAFVVAASAVVAVLTCASWLQASYWLSSESLWAHARLVTPGNYLADTNLGIILAGRGQLDDAVVAFEEALNIRPDDAKAHNNLGDILMRRGQVEDAMPHFRKALKINPNYAEAHYNLGIALRRRGQVDEAIAHFRQAVKIKPDHAKAHNNLGEALTFQGNLEDAIPHFQEALKIEPNYAEAHNNFGVALAYRGEFDAATAQFQKTLAIKPDDRDARYNLDQIRAKQK